MRELWSICVALRDRNDMTRAQFDTSRILANSGRPATARSNLLVDVVNKRGRVVSEHAKLDGGITEKHTHLGDEASTWTVGRQSHVDLIVSQRKQVVDRVCLKLDR